MKLALGRAAALLQAAMGAEEEGFGKAGSVLGAANPQALVLGYSIDSRTVAPGEMFFAVRGERLDGHDFVLQALEKGAVAAVVAREQRHRFAGDAPVLTVEEPLRALQNLGAAVRALWGKPLIAVTGSAGKTTTKEMIARLLGTRWRVLKSEGNFNNHFGLPLQLLRLEPEHDLAVLELGMSHAGEITRLARLAQPNLGVVTNVAPVHLGFFKSVSEIARAKKELIDALPPAGTGVLNADDEYVSQFDRDFAGRILTYGMNNPADVRAEAVEARGTDGSRFTIVTGRERYAAKLPLIGRHNVYNALAAVAVALQFEVGAEVAVAELDRLNAGDKRGNVEESAGATVINDCYNSNPRALDSMVDALAGMQPAKSGRRVVVAGEMLELGPWGEDLHRRCGQHMAEHGIDVVIGVRGLAKFIVEGATGVPAGRHSGPVYRRGKRLQAEFVESPQEAGEWLAQQIRPDDVVLLKASRGVRLERALETWREKLR